MIQELPPKANARHPFLALTPEARRQLARVLVNGLEASQDAELSRSTRHGLVGGAALTALGAGLYQGWYHLTGLDAAPFTLWYSLYVGVQAGVGHQMAKRGHSLGPNALRWAILAPVEAIAAARAWLFPERLRPDRLVLAGGILVAIRHPLSYHLLRRLYGRAYPQVEVDRAIALLRHLGLVIQKSREGSTVLLLAPAGVQLLHELGVADPEPRPRQDPAIAPHLRPIFALLEQTGARMPMVRPDAPDHPVAIERPVAEPVMPPPLERVVPPADVLPWEVEAPEEAHEEFHEPEPEPAPVVSLPVLPAEVAEPEEDELEEVVAAPPRRRAWPKIPARVVGIAAAILAVGALAVSIVHYWPQGPLSAPVRMTSAVMPSSQGRALQFNGRGMLLSSYRGDLYLSIADRLDYKRPLSFEGFDIPNGCSLKAGAIKAASMSPQGRFLWLETTRAGRVPERCLVDMETKTVTHDLAKKDGIYAMPSVVGWAGDTTLLMSEDATSRQAERWWMMDVTTHHAAPLELPRHGRTMLLQSANGAPLLLGLDMKRLGSWDVTTYFLDGKKQWEKLQDLHTEFPEALKESEPLHASLSPDKRFMLLAMRPVRPDAAGSGSLLVVSLADGTATALDGAIEADQPAFWGPEVRGGRYRFFYNTQTPEGDAPWTGEMMAGS